MDTKKLFEYETQLESLRPQLSDKEVVATLKNPDAISSEDATKVASFNLVQGVDGVYLKAIDADGNQTKLQYLNPVVAKSLASSLMQQLTALGYVEDEILAEELPNLYTIH